MVVKQKPTEHGKTIILQFKKKWLPVGRGKDGGTRLG